MKRTPVHLYTSTLVHQYTSTAKCYRLSRWASVMLASLILFVTPGSISKVFAQNFYCDMEYFDVDCTPISFDSVFYIPISTSPPCSVKVKMFGNRCDNAVEMLDMIVYYDDVIPFGCATRDQVHAAFAMWSQFTQSVYKEYFKGKALADGPIPDCPAAVTYVAVTPAACRRPVIVWQVPTEQPPFWTTVTVDYDLAVPWSFYEYSKPIGAIYPTIGLVNCGENCCYQLVRVCRQGTDIVVTPTYPGPMVDPCPIPNTNPNCRVFWCEP